MSVYNPTTSLPFRTLHNKCTAIISKDTIHLVAQASQTTAPSNAVGGLNLQPTGTFDRLPKVNIQLEEPPKASPTVIRSLKDLSMLTDDGREPITQPENTCPARSR